MSTAALTAELVACRGGEREVWAEWDWSGTRPHRTPLRMRGVTILGVEDDAVSWARFYMEPVDDDGVGVDGAVHDVATP